MHVTAALYFGAFTTAGELRLLIGATLTKAANVAGAIYVEGDVHGRLNLLRAYESTVDPLARTNPVL